MGTTGLIFGVIVLAWLAYLVPQYLRGQRQLSPSVSNPIERFSSGVRIVRESVVASAAAPERPLPKVTTPLTRRAQVAAIQAEARRAAGRRRVVLLVLGLALIVLTVLALFKITAWWTPAIPGGLLVAFVVVARVSVVAMERSFERRLQALSGNNVEDTISLDVADAVEPAPETEKSVEIVAPVASGGALWDPIPVTQPTYVQQPLSPRTVRTIDLSAPVVVTRNEPVTADADAEVRDLPRAVGE